MLQFRLFDYPVRIEWMFWVLCVLLGMNYLQESDPSGLGKFVLMTAVVLGSILWHELGHAWARKRSGAPWSEIILYGFGGLCGGPGHFTRGQSIAIAAAGPAASLLLGGLTWLLVFTPGIRNEWVAFFVGQMLWVNVGWAILNLLPILPLDGGRIFEGIVGPRHAALVPKVGFVLAIAIAVLGLVAGLLFSAVIFGMLAHGNWQRMRGVGAAY